MLSFFKIQKISFIITCAFLAGCTSVKFNTSHFVEPSVKPESQLRLLVSIGEEKNRFTNRARANKDLLDFAKSLEKKLIKNGVEVELFDMSNGNSEAVQKQINNSVSKSYRYTLILSWSHYTSNNKGGRQLTATFNLVDKTSGDAIWRSNTSNPVNGFQTPKVADEVINELVSLKFLKVATPEL